MSAPADFCPDSWPLVSCEPSGCSHLSNLDDDMQEVVATAAKEYLWRWSGRRFGLCPVTIRPCADPDTGCWTWSAVPFLDTGLGFFPYIRNGNWYNASCGRHNGQRCGCDKLSEIVLPGPVYGVTEILIDGELLSPTAYRLDNYGLARIDGTAWPKCQDMTRDPGSAESPDAEDHTGTFQVTYLRGVPVPAAGQLAAGTLACELAKQACGDKACRLPKRATMVVREGVTVQMPPDSAFFLTGATGVFEVDSFLASVQHDNRGGYAVLSPDVKKYRSTW